MVDSPKLIALDYGSIKTESDVTDWSDWGTTIPMGALVAGPINPTNNTAPVCTIGYFGQTVTNLNVAVTSGHCVPVGSNQDWFQPWNSGPDDRIGSFSFRTTSSASDGSDGISDSGYIVLGNEHEGIGSVVYPSTPDVTPVVGFYTDDLVNDTIYMRGAMTGATTSGTIRYSGVDVWWGSLGYGYKEDEMLAVGYTRTGGDSGGTILADYAWDNDRQSWTFDLAGTHTGQITVTNSQVVVDGTYRVYEPIWRTLNDLDINGVLLSQ